MIKWLGENGGELVGTNKYHCVQKKKRIFEYKYVSFIGFIGDALVEAQECYEQNFVVLGFGKYTSPNIAFLN